MTQVRFVFFMIVPHLDPDLDLDLDLNQDLDQDQDLDLDQDLDQDQDPDLDLDQDPDLDLNQDLDLDHISTGGLSSSLREFAYCSSPLLSYQSAAISASGKSVIG